MARPSVRRSTSSPAPSRANSSNPHQFQVTSRIDSRTILGDAGAEAVGSRRYAVHVGGGGIVRVHGPFVSDAEVQEAVEYLKTQRRAGLPTRHR